MLSSKRANELIENEEQLQKGRKPIDHGKKGLTIEEMSEMHAYKNYDYGDEYGEEGDLDSDGDDDYDYSCGDMALYESRIAKIDAIKTF